MYGATIGKLGLLNIPAATNQACACCICNDQVEPKFLFYWLKDYRDEFIKLGRGGGQPNISRELIYKQPFVLPPTKEQQRIVAKIESTQEKIKTIESNIAQAETLIERYRESILQKAFCGQLAPQNPNDEPASKLIEHIRAGRDKLTDPKKKKKDDLPPIKPEEIPFEIPKSWEWVRLGEILNLFNGHSFKQTEWKKTGVPIIRIQNLNNRETSQFNFYQGIVDQNWKVENGELLFAWSGSKGSSFGAHIWHNGDAVLNQHIFKVVPKNGIYKEYLYWLLRQFQKRIEEDAHGFKETFVHVRQSDLKKVVVPVPPFLEQKLIVKCLNDNLDISKKMIYKINLAKAFRLKLLSSILDSAFSGRLVPQDPSEGSGHDLLEDIKAQVTSQKNCDIKKLDSKKITISKKVSRKK